MEDSPTNKWFMEYYASGGKQEDLVAHIEPASDYDGLAVVWGIGNKKTSAEECAAHCKRHMPNQVPGEGAGGAARSGLAVARGGLGFWLMAQQPCVQSIIRSQLLPAMHR